MLDDGFAKADTPATESILCKRDGGITISRSALGYVVDGCPPASSVSSSNCKLLLVSLRRGLTVLLGTYLVHDIEVLSERLSGYLTEIFIQNVNERAQEGKHIEWVHCMA